LKGDLERALADESQAIQIFKLVTAYVYRGDIYRYKGDFERALADYDQALSIEPDSVTAHVGRGLTFEKMSNLPLARAVFERVLASQERFKVGLPGEAVATARSHIAAIDSGAPLPIIPTVPSKVASPNSIPTPVAAVPAASPTTHQGRRVALVIGNSAYRNVNPLANPRRDAGVVAASLRAVGFDTVMLTGDATHQMLIDALRAFADEAEQADWAAIYYAGHGIEVNGVNYLIPVDAKLSVDRDVQFEAIPLDQIMAALEGAKKLKLILLDACRDNPFTPQMRRTVRPEATAGSTAGGAVASRSIGRGLAEVKVSGATLVVYAAKHGQVALDGEGGDSPFAVALVQRIATPGVEINKIFRLVRDDVMEATAGRQEPYTYGSLPGREDFYFVQK
jgi:tetratricopeptide (TPR) repeat protein